MKMHLFILSAFFLLTSANRYEVTFYTGDSLLAGTIANVYVQLYSSNGTPSKPNKINSGMLDMRPGSIDTYEVSVTNLSGDIPLIKIWHDNSMLNPSWYVKKVELREIIDGKKGDVMTFPVHRWLAEKLIDITLPWSREGEETTRVVYAQQKYKGECGVSSNARMVNGKNALVGQFPWQAQIKIPFTYRPHSCGGALIHPQYVLTAAHCVNRMTDPESYLVTLGEYNLFGDDGTEQPMNVTELIPHPDYDRMKDLNDIALMKLSRPVILNRSVKLICLPDDGVPAKPDEKCLLSGWGRMDGASDHPANVLQYASFDIINNATCKKAMKGLGDMKEEAMVCAGKKGKASCQGDSGGPLACFQAEQKRFRVEGVVSWGSPTCDPSGKRYSVFSRVSHYIPWIETNIYSRYGFPE